MSAVSGGEPQKIQSTVVSVCKKVLGEEEFNRVMAVALRTVCERGSMVLRSAGVEEQHVALLVLVGQRVSARVDKIEEALNI